MYYFICPIGFCKLLDKNVFMLSAWLVIDCGFFHLLVARSDEGVDTTTEEGSDIGVVGEEAPDFDSIGDFSPAPGIDTISVFPKNFAKCKDGSV